MKHLAILRPKPGITAAQFGPHQIAEEREVWRLYTADIIRSMHWSGSPAAIDTVRIVIELETASTADAEAAIAGLPMIAAGLLASEIIPLSPWRPLEILFAK